MKRLKLKMYSSFFLFFTIMLIGCLAVFFIKNKVVLYTSFTVLLVLLGLIAYITTQTILKPLSEIVKATSQMASAQLKTKDSKPFDDIESIANSFDDFSKKINDLISKTIHLSDEVALSSDELSLSVKEIRDTSDHTADAIQQISKGSSEQTSKAKSSLHAMENMKGTIDQVQKTIESLSLVTATASKEAEEGKDYIEENIKQMKNINQSVQNLSSFIEKLNEHTSEIDSIIEVITSISSQINLLALNASIEASRAGEHGRGFMVVAAEVKKLAVESGNSASQISTIINEVSKNALQAVEYTDVVEKETEKGTAVADDTSKKFLNILDSIQNVSSEFNSLADLSQKISNNSSDVSMLMQETSVISESNMKQVEKVAFASEENLLSMKQIQDMSERLNKHAKDLRIYISQFDTSKEFKLGVSLPTAYHGWMGALVANTKAEAFNHDNIDTLLLTSNDASQQKKDLSTFIHHKVNAILLLPHDDSVSQLVEQATAQGIKVLILDREINTDRYFAYIGGDNEETGKGCAEVLLQTLEKEKGQYKANIIEIKGVNAPISDIRRKGFVEKINQYPGIKIVASEFGEFDREKAYKRTKKLLQQHDNIEFIYSQDDDMTIGIVKAVRDLGKEKDIRILSCAGMKEVYEMIQRKEFPRILVSVTYSPNMGATAVDFISKSLNDVPLKGNWTKVSNKKYIIPGIKVTESNVRTFYKPDSKF
ncbi:methyl-accepting chemotaxis protein [Salirhabdus euzebyi]|uniref:Methyl-accepting chemotaxis protein n=1 Tax=Salirhabdus euzebyi TaxID=394506 RepID=A0A841Q4U9_9BACI|nr:substrate-binding domain-containing protein [Salirhabdus euzebyi]MBB6453436.1 methyl-accepting chemotaxis protein [Salirhabdus euzebyi]